MSRKSQISDLLKNKRSAIFGLQGSGKTVFARYLASKAKSVFVYDPFDDYGDLKNADTYIPTFRDYSKEAIGELDKVIEYVLGRQFLPSLFIMDEAQRWCPNRRPLPESISKLNDFQGQFGMGLCFVSKRPAQLNTTLVELAHYYIIFRLRGRNDHLYLRNISTEVASASYRLKKWHYLVIDENVDFKEYPPLNVNTSTHRARA